MQFSHKLPMFAVLSAGICLAVFVRGWTEHQGGSRPTLPADSRTSAIISNSEDKLNAAFLSDQSGGQATRQIAVAETANPPIDQQTLSADRFSGQDNASIREPISMTELAALASSDDAFDQPRSLNEFIALLNDPATDSQGKLATEEEPIDEQTLRSLLPNN